MTGSIDNKNSQDPSDSDELEPSSAQGGASPKQLPAVVVASHEQYQLHEEHVPILPGQLLTDTIARLRFTIVLVSFFYSA